MQYTAMRSRQMALIQLHATGKAIFFQPRKFYLLALTSLLSSTIKLYLSLTTSVFLLTTGVFMKTVSIKDVLLSKIRTYIRQTLVHLSGDSEFHMSWWEMTMLYTFYHQDLTGTCNFLASTHQIWSCHSPWAIQIQVRRNAQRLANEDLNVYEEWCRKAGRTSRKLKWSLVRKFLDTLKPNSGDLIQWLIQKIYNHIFNQCTKYKKINKAPSTPTDE